MLFPLDKQICFTIYATALAINRAYKPMLDSMGLTYPQYLVLTALGEAGDLSIGAIATRLDLDSSTITPLMKRLEAAGLVTRQRSKSDERQVHVHMTDTGRDLLRRCACLNEALLERSGMTPDALDRLNEQIQALRVALIGSGAMAS